MRTIQRYVPHPRHTEVMRIFVDAKPDVAWQLARHYDLSSAKWVSFLFNLRTIADVFHHQRHRFRDEKIGSIDQIAQNGKGFLILEESPGTVVVVGAIGKFWHLDIPFRQIEPVTFKAFNETGWGKVAWSLTVEPYLEGSTIAFELRTTATDDESWKKLSVYYHVIGAFSKLIRHTLMHYLEKELGSLPLPDDKIRYLPGDEIIEDTEYTDTDHVNIEAPPSIVWRYLMQMGCDRAGWYSIDLLDNAGIKSVDRLLNEWGDRHKGDLIAATPGKDVFFEVYQVVHEELFILVASVNTEDRHFKSTWTFKLDPIGADATHLVVRARMIMTPQWKEWFMGNIFYPAVHGLMEGVQLKTIREYAERDAQIREREFVEV